ncbi:uncharacterized protein LOC144363543 [Saccoglossus kowalevskii]
MYTKNPHVNSRSDVAQQDPLLRLADILTKRQDGLPPMEPEVYSGSRMDFPTWLKSFEALIEKQTHSVTERNAKEAIRHFLTLEDEEAYEKAKYTLIRRYGDKFKVAEAYRDRLHRWPIIKQEDGEGLLKLSDFLEHCHAAMNSIHYLRCLDDPEENRKILSKLLRYMYVVDRWSRVIDRHLYGNQQQSYYYADYEGCYPSFTDFCEFMATEARIACGPGNIKVDNYKEDKKTYTNSRKARTLVSESTELNPMSSEQTSTENDVKGKNPSCIKCKESHHLSSCQQFLTLSVEDHKTFVVDNRLCFGCLNRGHCYRECRRRKYSSLCRTPDFQSSSKKVVQGQLGQSNSQKNSDTQSKPNVSMQKNAVSMKTKINTKQIEFEESEYHSMKRP